MATLNLRMQADIVLGGETKSMGSVTTAKTITLSEVVDPVITIATGTTRTLWNASGGSLFAEVDSFDFLWIEADQAIEIELTVTDGDANEVRQYHTLVANIPFVLADDASRLADSTLFNGTTGDIDKVQANNATGSTATVRMVIGKA